MPEESIYRIDRSDAFVEVGRRPEGGRVHAHQIFQVTHRTRLRLNANALKDMFDEELRRELARESAELAARFKGCYVHTTVERSFENYARKTLVRAMSRLEREGRLDELARLRARVDAEGGIYDPDLV